MSPRNVRVIVPTLALALIPAVLPAQGSFGSSIVVTGREVYVAQPANAYGPGVVYVFAPDAKGAWGGRAVAKITQATPTNGDGFGSAVAIDGNTMLIGQSKADSETGIVHVFTRAGSGAWRETGTITAPERRSGDEFGAKIVLANGRAFISTGFQGFGPMVFTRRSGSVFVFRNNGGTWTSEGTLASSDTSGGATFGNVVASSGSRVMVGNFRADSGNGAVYVFSRAASGDGGWKLDTKIPPPGPITGRNSGFGASIILRGDTAIVGAVNDRVAGAVWVFNRDSTSGQWQPVGRVLPFDGSFGARFGTTIAEVGNELWVGAVGANQFQGRVYRFTRDSTGFPTATKLGLPSLIDGDRFGGKIAASGSLVAVSVDNKDYGEGAVALYTKRANGTWQPAGQLVGEVAALTAITGAQRECNSGKVQMFDCHQVDLMSFTPVSALGGKRGVQLSDIWGYTDPQTGKEYALVGRVDGTAFVDISDPTKPLYLGELPKTAGSPGSFWREIKTYKHYAYIVSDGARNHGMQIFDLDRLRGVRTPQTFAEDAHYDKAHSVHDIVADTVSGFLYLTGSNSGGEMCGGGLHMVDVREPLKPKFAGCFSDPQTGRQGTGYTHDAQCVVYRGPTAKYQGRQICLGWNETHLSIADVTDKAHPVAISRATYPNVGYAHQGWLTDDHRYAYEDDELDEIEGLVDGTRTLIWDVSDLENPVLAGQYISKNKATDHNLWLVGNTMYQSNYVSGLRVLDITDRLHPKEIGFFDTHPVGPDEPGFEGTWGNYPFFKSGVVVVSSMTEGLFVLKARPVNPVP